MSDRPYFITWAKQKEACVFTLLAADGVHVKTQEYGDLIDLTSTSYQVSFGHNEPTITAEVMAQMKIFSTASPKAVFPLKEKISRQLAQLMELKDGKFFYTVSGAEAIENALKMARQLSSRKTIAALKRSYHGATLGAMSVTGDWRYDDHFTVGEYTLRIPSPQDDPDGQQCRRVIEQYGPEKIAAFCLETVTGGNGAYAAPAQWWDEIQKICDEYQILLILDEVICGFYRTGKAFGFHHYNLRPDLVCLSKSITGGLIPFGALWVAPALAKSFDHRVFSYGLTHYAHPLGLAATAGVLKILHSPNWSSQLQTRLDCFKEELEKIKPLKAVVEIRQVGMLAAIEISHPIPQEVLFQNGLYMISQQNTLMLAPALNIAPKVLKQALGRLKHLIENEVSL